MNFVEKNGGPHLHIKMQEKLDLLLNCRGPFTDVFYEANKWKFLFKYRKKVTNNKSGRIPGGWIPAGWIRSSGGDSSSRHVT